MITIVIWTFKSQYVNIFVCSNSFKYDNGHFLIVVKSILCSLPISRPSDLDLSPAACDNMNNTTGATLGEGPAYPAGEPDVTLSLCCTVFSFLYYD